MKVDSPLICHNAKKQVWQKCRRCFPLLRHCGELRIHIPAFALTSKQNRQTHPVWLLRLSFLSLSCFAFVDSFLSQLAFRQLSTTRPSVSAQIELHPSALFSIPVSSIPFLPFSSHPLLIEPVDDNNKRPHRLTNTQTIFCFCCVSLFSIPFYFLRTSFPLPLSSCGLQRHIYE